MGIPATGLRKVTTSAFTSFLLSVCLIIIFPIDQHKQAAIMSRSPICGMMVCPFVEIRKFPNNIAKTAINFTQVIFSLRKIHARIVVVTNANLTRKPAFIAEVKATPELLKKPPRPKWTAFAISNAIRIFLGRSLTLL